MDRGGIGQSIPEVCGRMTEQTHIERISFAKDALCALAYMVVTLSICILLGAFGVNGIDSHTLLRERNAAVALPIFSAYLWLANQYLLSRTLSCTRRYMQNNRTDLDPDAVAIQMKERTKVNGRVSILIGTTVASIYMYSEGLLAFDLSPLRLFLNVLAIAFWILCVFSTLQVIYVTRFVINNFLNRKNIDLFSIKKLIPISDLVITNTVLSSLCLALIPLFWVGQVIPTIDKFIVAGVFLMLCWFLFWPVLRVQKTISAKKSMAIERINESVKLLFDDSHEDKRRLTDDPERLRQLSALISAKREIANASEWPINLPQSLKGLLFSLSIPLSWVAGSLIETFISRFNVL